MNNRRVNVSDNVYNKLKEKFIDGSLKFGERISETEYCDILHVSRTPLREAIKRLENEGIIEREKNGRLKIMDMDISKIEEIFEIRTSLEYLIMKNLISSSNFDEIVLQLEQNLALTKFHIDNKNFKDASPLFKEFNKIMYENSNMVFTIKILKIYQVIIQKLRSKSLEEKERIVSAYSEHIGILDAIKEKNLLLLAKRNEEHISNSKKNILSIYKK